MGKLCSRCKLHEALSYSCWCRDCYNAGKRETYRRRICKDETRFRVKIDEQFKNFYETPHGRAVHMLNSINSHTKGKDVKNLLSVKWLETRILNGICEATGLPLVLRKTTDHGRKNNAFSPSIERIDPNGDYTEENCQVTCWIYNRSKGAFAKESFDKFANALYSKITSNSIPD